MAKVVYNGCFGGFGLSSVAVIAMADLGHEAARLAVVESRTDEYALDRFARLVDRHDPILVQVVETLGPNVSGGRCSKLFVAELAGDRYIVEEYDGSESVVEPADLEWTVIA